MFSQAGIWGERILGSSAGMVEGADISNENGKTRPPEQVRKARVGIFLSNHPQGLLRVKELGEKGVDSCGTEWVEMGKQGEICLLMDSNYICR